MAMNPGKVISVGALFLGALACDYIRTKFVGSYDFPEDNKQAASTDDQEQDESDDNQSPS